MAEINVTSWGTREPLKNDASAPMHDCLWEIAQEQAVLDRMQRASEDWQSAGGKVSQQDIKKQLDVICDDNGFRRLDGSGNGRNPNLIYKDERIKVRIDPKQLDQPAPGVTNNQSSQGAYNKAVSTDSGKGVDLNKKQEVDTWLESVKGFPGLPEDTKKALLTAYTVPGMDRQTLATLGGSEALRKLQPDQQQQLLGVYGAKGTQVATAEVDKIAAAPVTEESSRRLALVGTLGFFKMGENAQKLVLDRYSQDAQFRAAIDRIVAQENFKGKGSVEQAHALDILGRYSQRKGEAYGEVKEDKRSEVLVKLYDQVLSSPGFNLINVDSSKQETDTQRDAIDRFVSEKVDDIAGTAKKSDTASTPPEVQYWD